MANHNTTACGRRKRTENDTNNGDTSTTKNDERTCYDCDLPALFKTNCIHFKPVRDHPNNVNIGAASVPLATAEDCELI
jgi:hypothetical protein